MRKITIKPSWVFISENGERIDPHLFTLLRTIHSTHKLTLAAKAANLSYRHSWDLLTKWAEFFGSPLVTMERGKGSRLTALGEKLVWAEQRSDARLFPQLENIASELNLELANTLQEVKPVIRIHASHGFAIAKLPELMMQQGYATIDLQYTGSIEALQSLAQGHCDCAGFHMPAGEIGVDVRNRYLPYLKLSGQKIIRLVTRTQGLMLAANNPHGISSLNDLASKALRFVNRQPGAGTRVLFDHLLQKQSIDPTRIQGYNNIEFTHSAVAAFIASNMADVGFGVEAAARQFNLAFIPIIREHYMLTCRKETLKSQAMHNMLGAIKSDAFIAMVNQLPGYAIDHAGECISVNEMRSAIAN